MCIPIGCYILGRYRKPPTSTELLDRDSHALGEFPQAGLATADWNELTWYAALYHDIFQGTSDSLDQSSTPKPR